MRFIDPVYGTEEVTEPVLLELLKTPALERLKHIDQVGFFDGFFKGGTSYTRYEHSVGCLMLLRRFNASLEEQIAGLIHDVSHSAFSHCIDYVLEEGSQTEHSHQDNIFEEYVHSTTIPDILTRYGFDVEYILNEKKQGIS